MTVKLYYWPQSSATRVVWALEELGIPWERVRLDRSRNEHKAPAFLAVNPYGTVPALVDDGANLFDSLAILLHLGEKYGVAKGLWPQPGSSAAADAIMWTVWGTVQMLPPVIERAVNTETPFALPAERRSAELAERAHARFYDVLRPFEQRLESRAYTLGDAFSLVDVANAALLGTAQFVVKLSLDTLPATKAWFGRCAARPAFGHAMSER